VLPLDKSLLMGVLTSDELLKDKPGYSNRAALVKEVQVLDRYTVRFDLQLPDPQFYLNVVNALSPVIVPRAAVEAPGGLTAHPVGTGAFRLKEFVPGAGTLLVRHPDYCLREKDGRQLPYVDAVRLGCTTDAATEMALFRSRQLDGLRVATLDLLYELLKTVPELRLSRVPSLGWGDDGLTLALKKASSHAVRVRQALSMVMNRTVVAAVINRVDAALYGPFPWGMAGYTQRRDDTYVNLGPHYEYHPPPSPRVPGRGGLPHRLCPGAGMGRAPGLDLWRLWATAGTRFGGHWRARPAQTAGDAHLDDYHRRGPAGCQCAGRPQAERGRASGTG
jgi:ABC-type transport system substrate-binding protein